VWIFDLKNRFHWKDKVEVSGSSDEEAKPLILAYKI